MVEDMCSVPPATMVVALPTMMRSEAMAHPIMTSSTSSLSSPSARPTASPIAAAAMSSGRLARKVPPGARPTAVLAPETITASRMVAPFSRSARSGLAASACQLVSTAPASPDDLSAFQLSRFLADMLVPLQFSRFQQCLDAFVGLLLFQEFEESLFLQL